MNFIALFSKFQVGNHIRILVLVALYQFHEFFIFISKYRLGLLNIVLQAVHQSALVVLGICRQVVECDYLVIQLL